MDSHADDPNDRGKILFVCDNNVCRSPYMELVARHALAGRGVPIDVLSAGTRARAGRRISDPIANALLEDGIDASSFVANTLDRDLVEAADVILTAESSHRSTVARMLPSALPRVFTLLQFARLVAVKNPTAAGGGARLRDLTRQAALLRGTTQPAGGLADDVEDPWQHSAAAYRRSVASMRAPLKRIVGSLTESRHRG